MPDQPKYFIHTPEELEGYTLVETEPEPPNPDKNREKRTNLKEIKDNITSLQDALNQRAKEFGLSAPKLDLPPLPPDFTKEHLEALNEIFGQGNLEATVCPTLEQLTDQYFQMMYPETQRDEDTARGLKSYQPDWWNKTAGAGFSITDEEAERTNQTRATWVELYTKSIHTEVNTLQNTILLTETIQKPDYKNGTQHYGTKEGKDETKDKLLPIIRQIFGDTANRCNLTWDQFNQELIPKLKEEVLKKFQSKKLKLTNIEIIITPAIVSNLQTTLKHPSDSQTNTSDWSSTPLIDQYDKDSGHRLVVGDSGVGGAGYVDRVRRGLGWDGVGFRLSVALKNT